MTSKNKISARESPNYKRSFMIEYLDKIINPGGEVVNFRNCGLTQKEIETGLSISETRIELEEVFKDKCVVGHNLSQFILNFSRPNESLDLAFYNPLHYLIMSITKVRYSGLIFSFFTEID